MRESPSTPEPARPTEAQKAPADLRSHTTTKDVLELFGKIAIGLAGLCYVLGLIVVTVHLRSYGLNSLDLPQLRYVMAGVWAMLPILLTVLLTVLAIYFFQVQFERRENLTRWKKLGNVLSVIFMLLFFFYAVLGRFGGRLGLTFGWKSWVLVPLLGTLAVFFLATPALMFTRSETYSSLGSIILNLGAMVVGLLLGLWYLFVFASNTYRSIPWSTGGGSPSQVQLMIDSKFSEYVKGVGINLTETSATAGKTDSISLLMVTDKEYVVVNPKGKAVGIPVDTVRSVLYEK